MGFQLVESDQMQLIEYSGEPLQSDRDYYWKVAVKDETGNISCFSEVAKWSTGLFSAEVDRYMDWHG